MTGRQLFYQVSASKRYFEKIKLFLKTMFEIKMMLNMNYKKEFIDIFSVIIQYYAYYLLNLI